jgi:cyclopropane-fatty-acyl-phospholipid synthase
LARDLVFARLRALSWGRVTIVENDRAESFGAAEGPAVANATVTVLDPQFYAALAFAGNVGAGEAYIQGFWTCDDLPGLIRIMLRNMSVLTRIETGWARLAQPTLRLYHALQRNTRGGSRRNIAAHYDLGNEFYALFLDETMTYSCGVFDRAESTLAEASIQKYDRICRKLELGPNDHVVEIGCGWGGFAIHAATQYGCRVTGTTISQRQHQWATQRVERMGLTKQVTILLKDYRDVTGTFDKLVSIEMIEAVGHHYLDRFLQCCSRLVKPDGLLAIQAITITDQLYRIHVRSVDFIKRYIFPGSCLLSVTALCNAATRSTDLRVVDLEDITPHYAETLRRWRRTFFERIEEVRALGFDDAFVRMWDFYLGYCEGAFDERHIGDIQMVFAKPLWRGARVVGDRVLTSKETTPRES